MANVSEKKVSDRNCNADVVSVIRSKDCQFFEHDIINVGMTVKGAERIIKANMDYYTGTDYDGYAGFDHEDVEAFNIAISVMEKYQQIEQIRDMYNEHYIEWRGVDSCAAFRKIMEIVGDVRE